MKKIYILFLGIILFIIPLSVSAKKEKVELKKCIDGDTIKVIYNGEERKLRLLAIDAPEIDEEEDYATEAKDYLCKLVSESKDIKIEFDPKSDKEDKYERLLVWLYVDDNLAQEMILKSGFAKVKYVYDKYKYIDKLNEAESFAKDNKLNIWSDYEYIKEEKANNKETKSKKITKEKIIDIIEKYYTLIVVIIAMILALITYYQKNKNKKKKIKK